MKRILTIIALMLVFATSAKAQFISPTSESQSTKPENNSLYKPTGHYLGVEGGLTFTGYPWGCISISYDYQINPYIMIGGGLGFNLGVPLYAEALFSTPQYKWSFYLNVKLGYDIWYEDPFVALVVGANYKQLGLGFGGFSCDGGFHPCIVINYKLPLRVYR